MKCCNKKCVLSYADDKCENENRLEGDACDLSTPNIYWNQCAPGTQCLNNVCTNFDKPEDVIDRQQKEVAGVFEPLPSEVKAGKE